MFYFILFYLFEFIFLFFIFHRRIQNFFQNNLLLHSVLKNVNSQDLIEERCSERGGGDGTDSVWKDVNEILPSSNFNNNNNNNNNNNDSNNNNNNNDNNNNGNNNNNNNNNNDNNNSNKTKIIAHL